MEEKREESTATEEARGVVVAPADSGRDQCLVCDGKADVTLKFGRFHVWTIRLCEEHKAELLSALVGTALPDVGVFGPSPLTALIGFRYKLDRILNLMFACPESDAVAVANAESLIMEAMAGGVVPDQIFTVPLGGGEIDGMEAWGTVEDVKLDEGDRVLIVRKRDPK